MIESDVMAPFRHHSTAPAFKVGKCKTVSRQCWTIRKQLLLAVNLPLAILLGMLLVLDYRRGTETSISQKQAGLQVDALMIAQGLTDLSRLGRAKPIQDFVDRICAGMQETHSPGHHIAVRVGDQVVQARAHQRDSPQMLQAMRNAVQSPNSYASFGNEPLVVGSFFAKDVEVYVSQNTADIRKLIQNELLSHTLSLAALGVVAAGIVNLVLLRSVVRPLQLLSCAVGRVAEGDYAVKKNRFRSRELIGLSDAIQRMAATMAANEQDRGVQMDRARQIQEHLLPNGVEVPGLAVAHSFQPADVVAGDYYDLIPLPDDSWLVCVADVTGHGIAAALGASMLKALVMHATEHHQDPRSILGVVNHHLPSFLPSQFITMFLARWNPATSELEYASAGHEPGLLISSQGTVRELAATGLPLGIDPSLEWETVSLNFRPGQRLVLTTDGVAEAGNPTGELFGRNRLTDVASARDVGSPREVVNSICEAVSRHRLGQRSDDDVTILVLEANPMRRVGS